MNQQNFLIAKLAFLLAVSFSTVDPTWSQDEDQPMLTDEQREQKIAEPEGLKQWASEIDREQKLDGAIAIANRSLKIEVEFLGKTHPEIAESIGWVATRRESLEQFEQAIRARKKVLEILTEGHGEDHWKVTDARLALANVKTLQNLTPDQRDTLRHVLSEKQRMSQFFHSGNYKQAIEIGESVLAMQAVLFGKLHPDYATSLTNLAGMFSSRGDNQRTESLYLKAMMILEKAFGKEHASYADSLNNLAMMYQATGDYQRTEPLHLEAIAIREKVLGTEHPDYALSLNNLAFLYFSMGDYQRAEPPYLEAMAIYEKSAGKQRLSPEFWAAFSLSGDWR